MQLLRQLLNESGIQWADNSDPQLGIMRTRIAGGFREYSVIFGPCSYGAPEGLLELWDFVHDVVGHLTASEAFRLIDDGLGCNPERLQ